MTNTHIIRATLAKLGLLAMAFSVGTAHAQSYNPVGVQESVPVATVTNGDWVECFRETYDKGGTSIDNAIASCTGSKLMMACRPTGDSTLTVLAQAPIADVMFDTGTDSTTVHNANGVDWYFNRNFSWGFTDPAQSVNKNQCDIAQGSKKMCVHTLAHQGFPANSITSGFSCGSLQNLNFDASYERIFYTNKFAVSTTSLPAGTQGLTYGPVPVNAAPGTAPFAWSANGLPAGLTMDPATGVISGTPTVIGTFSVTVSVTDSASPAHTATQVLSLLVNPAALAVTTTTLPVATQGQAFTAPVAASGGTTPYTWAATGLPAGLTMDPTTGVIRGTPTASGTSSVVITVTDQAGQTQTATLSLLVNAVASANVQPVPGLGTLGLGLLAALAALAAATGLRRRRS